MKIGDLVRLGMRHREFGITVFSDKYGIIMEVSRVDSNAVIVFSYGDGGWAVLNLIHDEFELLSG